MAEKGLQGRMTQGKGYRCIKEAGMPSFQLICGSQCFSERAAFEYLLHSHSNDPTLSLHYFNKFLRLNQFKKKKLLVQFTVFDILAHDQVVMLLLACGSTVYYSRSMKKREREKEKKIRILQSSSRVHLQ
jgi:hypothetical protein